MVGGWVKLFACRPYSTWKNLKVDGGDVASSQGCRSQPCTASWNPPETPHREVWPLVSSSPVRKECYIYYSQSKDAYNYYQYLSNWNYYDSSLISACSRSEYLLLSNFRFLWYNQYWCIGDFCLDGETVGIFRYASKDVTMQPSEVLSHRVPQDFLDLSRGEDATKLIDFLRMVSVNNDTIERCTAL